MTTGTAETQQGARSTSVRLVALVGGLALLCGMAIGAKWSFVSDDGWHTGQGYAGLNQVSVEYKGWTYGAGASVPWIDAAGSWHEGGWPPCLQRLKNQPVRFQARSVTVDNTSWRPIVAIDCRS